MNNKLVFIGSRHFVNSSLDVVVRNWSHNDFKYLSGEFPGDLLELVKQRGVYPYKFMGSFKKPSEDKLSKKCDFLVL